MQISAANTSIPSRPIEHPVPPTPAPERPVLPADSVSVRRVAALLSVLENKPEIRPEVVARGRALASDTSYPPPEIIAKLAGLIVGDNQ